MAPRFQNLCDSRSNFSVQVSTTICKECDNDMKLCRLDHLLDLYFFFRRETYALNSSVNGSYFLMFKPQIWRIPEGGLTEDVKESAIDLIGHRKKVGIIQWHPTANNILASAGFEYNIIIWDVEKGSPVHVISGHTDVINGLDWSLDGSFLATSCKDKKARIIDPRAVEEERIVHVSPNILVGFRILY